MDRSVSNVAFTKAIKDAQQSRGSREAYSRMEQRDNRNGEITPELAEFIAQRDSLYLGTASRDGQPYIQHRGGPRGFLKVLDSHTLAMADYAGNAQYISIGNLTENRKAFLFLMDYPNRSRIKIWGCAKFVENDPELLARVADAGYAGRPERVLLFHVRAWDANCSQHIRPRLAEDEMTPGLHQREV